MSRFLITNLNGKRMTCREDDGRISEIHPEDTEALSDVGNIYIARVKHIKKDLNAAFLEYAPGKMCYYPLEELTRFPIKGKPAPLHEGDDLLVQIEKDALKMKAAVATTNLTFTGEYLVLMTGKTGLNFSSKIKGRETKERIRSILEPLLPEETASFGLIIRTNAQDAPDSALLHEFSALSEKAKELLNLWTMRKAGQLLWKQEDAMISEIYNNQISRVSEIVTDDPAVFEQLKEKQKALAQLDPDRILPSLRFYDDSYSLVKLYRLETHLERALSKRVWLKSGGFLIIEPTEALVVIDVNTGKSDGKKKPDDTFLHTNLEAAKEIAFQLKLRNLSGIIVVDFIDMKEEEHRKEVVKALSDALQYDPVKTTVLGFTRLGLLEMTRKKVRKPLHELMK